MDSNSSECLGRQSLVSFVVFVLIGDSYRYFFLLDPDLFGGTSFGLALRRLDYLQLEEQPSVVVLLLLQN
jgi:hypothetical protein